MKPFMDADFLLENDVAKKLYHDYAENMPIYDYHCHIPPAQIAENHKFANIGELMLGGDHYKWRVMLSNGVDDKFCRGDASWLEKWKAFAASLKYCVGNPMYHWTHLELKRVFGIDEVLTEKNAEDIWNRANALLEKDEFRCHGLIEKFGVKLICTTDDPVDDLRWHEKLAADPTAPAVVLPAFRPDKAMRADKPTFPAYVAQLEKVVGFPINTVEDMRKALINRIGYFNDHNCRVSDHALDYCFCVEATEAQLDDIFARAKSGKGITWDEQLAYHTALLIAVGKEYCRLNWVNQLHFACLRDNSTKMFAKLGPDTGFDCINDQPNAAGLAKLLGKLEAEGALAKTILYSLNPSDNGVIGTIIGCFQTDSPIPGKIQQGSAWWFNDHKPGMEAQMVSLMSLGAMGTFNGMLTDSRSFLSYTRHEYFRRILCNLFGQLVEDGEYPADMKTLGKMVENISYNNTLHYFRFDELIK